MKTKYIFRKGLLTFTGMCLSAFLFTQCNTQTTTSEDVANETEEAVEATSDFVEEERKELSTEIENKIDDLQARMESVDDEEIKADIKEKVDNLNSELSKVKEATEDNWEEVKADTREAFNNINSEIQEELN